MMTRLLEEAGEPAQQINHFENTGIKRAKHGEPSKAKPAKEVQDVLRCVLRVVSNKSLRLRSRNLIVICKQRDSSRQTKARLRANYDNAPTKYRSSDTIGPRRGQGTWDVRVC